MTSLSDLEASDRALIASLREHEWPETTLAVTVWAQRSFTQFIRENGLQHEDREQAMMRWAHSQYPNLAWATVHGRFHSVHRWAVACGEPSPLGSRARKYLKGIGRELGRRKDKRTDPIRVQDAQEIVTAMRADRISELDRLVQAALVLSHVTGLPVIASGRRPAQNCSATLIDRSTIIVDDARITVSIPGHRRVIIDAARSPLLHGVVTEALRGQAMAGPLLPTPRGKANADVRLLWERMCLPGSPCDAGILRALSVQDMIWTVLCVEKRLAIRLRDTAYLTAGVLLARRHEQLERLLLRHVSESHDGYDVFFPKSKADQQGRGLTKHLTHAVPGQECTVVEPCHTLCPVRAMADHLEVTLRYQGRTRGPLFATKHDDKFKAMSIKTAEGRLRQLWDQAGLEGDAKIGTRSMRVGGATSALEAGWTVVEIATLLTDHKTYWVAALYLRHASPYSGTMQVHPEPPDSARPGDI